jgi:hypothetical protein
MPPKIKHYFDRLLLATPFKLGDDLESLHKLYSYIKQVAEKFRKYPAEYTKWQEVEKKYLELYRRAEAKEKIQGPKAKNRTKEPFYFVRLSSRRNERLLNGLRRKAAYASYRSG